MNHEEKTEKEVILPIIFSWPYNFQVFAQTQKNFARSHDRETVTFRNSASPPLTWVGEGDLTNTRIEGRKFWYIFSRPAGFAWGCSTNTVVIILVIN